jgi:hypothetical protein
MNELAGSWLASPEELCSVEQVSKTVSIKICLLIYLLTPWSRVLLEKLTGSQLVKKFPKFNGTWRFITAFTSAHHLSMS